MTDLPYGRGGSPLQNLIVRGHKNTQLSAIKCIADLDAGPIYAKRSLSLDGSAEDILRRASGIIKELIVWIVKNNPHPEMQVGPVVEFKRRMQNDGDISGLEELNLVYDYIRMLDADGYPPAFINSSKLSFEFSNARMKDDAVLAQVLIKRRIDD